MLNLAIAGLGIWGRTLVEAVQGKSDQVRFSTAVVRDREARSAFAAAHGLRLVSSLEGGYDLAALATATAAHVRALMSL